MKAILAIETGTDACSVALYRRGEYRQCHEVLPRQHNQRLFPMLSELVSPGNLRDQGVEALAYGCGPGSFTGLRIAASAVQGLAYASDLPVVPVSTLACQAATALRQGLTDGRRTVLSTLDARINEIYWAFFSYDSGAPVLQAGPFATPPEQVVLPDRLESVDIVGSGARYLDRFPGALGDSVAEAHPDLLPEARDLVPLALSSLAAEDWQTALEVRPVYVRDEISWRKLSEQGRPQ